MARLIRSEMEFLSVPVGEVVRVILDEKTQREMIKFGEDEEHQMFIEVSRRNPNYIGIWSNPIRALQFGGPSTALNRNTYGAVRLNSIHLAYEEISPEDERYQKAQRFLEQLNDCGEIQK